LQTRVSPLSGLLQRLAPWPPGTDDATIFSAWLVRNDFRFRRHAALKR
jgi:hypothetical protein